MQHQKHCMEQQHAVDFNKQFNKFLQSKT
jgi:hypothetical protein